MNKRAKHLIKVNWELCRKVAEERDGYKCIICEATERLQLDHCITRNKKKVFYETDHLNFLCPHCHTTKSFQSGCALDKRVDQITIKRIGKRRYDELLRMSEGVCRGWATIWYQEEQFELLTEALEFYKIRSE